MGRRIVICVILIIAILIISVLLVNYSLVKNSSVNETETVYVGVTYCGNSVAEGKALIDKVKDYTNLFVLQSFSLQRDLERVNEIGDYAVSKGMYFLIYFNLYIEERCSVWFNAAKQEWGEKLLGVYYGDEPGGRMLDAYVEFRNTLTGDSIMKTTYGDVVLEKSDGVVIHYEIGGIIHLYIPSSYQNSNNTEIYATFYPDGSIKADKSENSSIINEITNLFGYATYEQLMRLRPFKDIHEVADQFVTRDQYNIKFISNATTVFTSDYALYWFDYLSGYDVILAHIGWNHTLAQDIALIRGAARAQNKDWGVVITWKYTNPPYLDTGTEILNQMRTAYECGAKYLVLFNYYEGGSNPYGTVKDEHFQALEDFWNNVVKNPQITQGSIEADSVLVLPKNYGWGMRWSEDKIWGIFKADDKTQQLWDLLQSTLKNHNLKTDIVYEDADYPLIGEYQNIYNWATK